MMGAVPRSPRTRRNSNYVVYGACLLVDVGREDARAARDRIRSRWLSSQLARPWVPFQLHQWGPDGHRPTRSDDGCPLLCRICGLSPINRCTDFGESWTLVVHTPAPKYTSMPLLADPLNGSVVKVSGLVSKMMQPAGGHALIAADRLVYFTPSTYSMLSLSPALSLALVPCGASGHARIAKIKVRFFHCERLPSKRPTE